MLISSKKSRSVTDARFRMTLADSEPSSFFVMKKFRAKEVRNPNMPPNIRLRTKAPIYMADFLEYLHQLLINKLGVTSTLFLTTIVQNKSPITGRTTLKMILM